MTPEQMDKLTEFLHEEFENIVQAQRRFVRNHEDFAEFAQTALKQETFRAAIELGLIGVIVATMDRAGITEKIKNKTLANDPAINAVPLDMLWLGYQVGRRMHEWEALRMSEYERG